MVLKVLVQGVEGRSHMQRMRNENVITLFQQPQQNLIVSKQCFQNIEEIFPTKSFIPSTVINQV